MQYNVLYRICCCLPRRSASGKYNFPTVCKQAATAEAASKHWKAEVTSEHVEVHVYCNTDTAKAYRSQLDVLVRQPNVQLHVKRVWRSVYPIQGVAVRCICFRLVPPMHTMEAYASQPYTGPWLCM